MFEVVPVSGRFRRTRAVDIEHAFESNRRSIAARAVDGTGGQVMGCVQQAVLEFDEEVQAPWRPRLVSVPDAADPPARPVERRPSRRSPSRVGVCRPPAPPRGRAPWPRRAAVRAGLAPGASPARSGRSARPASGRPRSTRLRLTRRARRLAVVLALCGGRGARLVAGLARRRAARARPAPGRREQRGRAAGRHAVVDRGVGGRRGRRPGVVDRIQELNGLDGADLVPGQVLQLP